MSEETFASVVVLALIMVVAFLLLTALESQQVKESPTLYETVCLNGVEYYKSRKTSVVKYTREGEVSLCINNL